MAEQPLPTAGQQDVTESLIALLRERQRKGIETYGRSLETFNGRDATRDLVEELIDAVQYARQWQLERADLTRQLDEAVQRAERAEQEVEGFSQANAIVNATLKQTTAQLERAEGAEFDIRYQVEEQRQRAERAESDLAACQTRYQASQEALTEAIEEMREVRAENERMRAALKGNQWTDPADHQAGAMFCQGCGVYMGDKHDAGCWIENALNPRKEPTDPPTPTNPRPLCRRAGVGVEGTMTKADSATIILHLSDGRQLAAKASRLVQTFRGWVPVSSLKEGDTLVDGARGGVTILVARNAAGEATE